MLTREEAKTKQCPYVGFYRTQKSLLIAIEKSEHGRQLHESTVEILMENMCKAENCPKWKDEFIRDNPCKEYPCKEHRADCYENVSPHYPENLNHQKLYTEYCLNCPKHFGRCGG